MLSRRAILTLCLLLPFTVQVAEGASSQKKKRRHRVPVQTEESAKPATAASQRTLSARSEASAKPVASRSASSSSQRSSASSKLASHAVDAIPDATQTPSLYDRHSAATVKPPSGGLFGMFGPKADGIRYDSRMIQAAQIAEARARQHSVRSCWRYVKTALLAANVVDTYPQTALAKQAGDELINKHGFRRLAITDPFKAPIGSVIVYGGRGAGHVEIRTADGFVSDFESPTPSKRPLLGIFVKPS